MLAPHEPLPVWIRNSVHLALVKMVELMNVRIDTQFVGGLKRKFFTLAGRRKSVDTVQLPPSPTAAAALCGRGALHVRLPQIDGR